MSAPEFFAAVQHVIDVHRPHDPLYDTIYSALRGTGLAEDDAHHIAEQATATARWFVQRDADEARAAVAAEYCPGDHAGVVCRRCGT